MQLTLVHGSVLRIVIKYLETCNDRGCSLVAMIVRQG